jgi:peptidylprolyl isomerase
LRRLSTSSTVPSAPALGSVFTREVVLGMAALGFCSGCSLVYMQVQSASDIAAAQSLPLYEGNPVVYLDVFDGEESVGRLVLQLRADLVPRTAENFRVLCAGTLGWGYKGSPVHCVEKGRRVFAGDFFGSGNAGFSIYGDTFEDEGGFALRHEGPGVLGMRNWGPDTNNSQFYITLTRLPELDGRSTALGNVLEGWDVLWHLNKCAKLSGDKFAKKHAFRIKACGELKDFAGRERVQPPAPVGSKALLA